MKFATKLTATPFNNSLKYALHKHLAGYSPARSSKVIHASDMMKESSEFCPRMYALLDITKKKPKDEFLTTSQRVTFKLGYALAEAVTDWLADAGMVIGDWRCNNCKTHYRFQKRPLECKTVGCCHTTFTYEEVRFKSGYSSISGGVDLLVDFGAPLYELVELKTIDKEEFKKLEMPFAEHRWRTNLYLRLVEESDHPHKARINCNRARVLYISKGGWGCADSQPKEWGLKDGGFSPFKEFFIERKDVDTQKLSDYARMVKTFRETGLIPQGVCPTSFCSRAKYCPVVQDCFSGQWEAGNYVEVV